MIPILTACGVLSAVALIAGILLALINRFFGIEDDPKVKQIRNSLPSVNCGACGYKGCDDYANAVASGKAKPNLCIPGGEATANCLGEILNIKIDGPENAAAFIHCNGNCEATQKGHKYDGISTCNAASQLFGGPSECKFGCLGYGDCAAVCPQNAICMKDGIAHVDTDRCSGCGLCSKTCPKKLISIIPKTSSVTVMCSSKDKGAVARKKCKNACIGCKKCEKSCPVNAITVTDNLARIDYSKCTGCRSCLENCPTGCIKDISVNKI